MDHNPEDECLVGIERSLMVKSMMLKGLIVEWRLMSSEMGTLKRARQTGHVFERKQFIERRVPEMEEEMFELRRELQRMLDRGGDQMNPSGKYYILAERLLKA